MIKADEQEQAKEEMQAVEAQQNYDIGKINNWGYFLLFSYLYVIQGIVSGFASTMPYLYAQLPN